MEELIAEEETQVNGIIVIIHFTWWSLNKHVRYMSIQDMRKVKFRKRKFRVTLRYSNLPKTTLPHLEDSFLPYRLNKEPLFSLRPPSLPSLNPLTDVVFIYLFYLGMFPSSC